MDKVERRLQRKSAVPRMRLSGSFLTSGGIGSPSCCRTANATEMLFLAWAREVGFLLKLTGSIVRLVTSDSKTPFLRGSCRKCMLWESSKWAKSRVSSHSRTASFEGGGGSITVSCCLSADSWSGASFGLVSCVTTKVLFLCGVNFA